MHNTIRVCYGAGFFALTATLALAPTGRLWSQDLRDVFYSNGKRIPVTIQQNSLGVVVGDEIDNVKEVLETAARATKLQVTKVVPGGISVLSSTEDLSVSELERRARSLTQTLVKSATEKEEPAAKDQDDKNPDPPAIRHAGLLVLSKGLKEPFVVTAEFVVQFKQGIPREAARELIKKQNVEIVRERRFGRKTFLLRSTNASKLGFFEAPNQFHQMGEVEFSHPNLVHPVRSFSEPNDAKFGKQWHHLNSGQKGGIPDADIDTDLAWDITTGDENIVIAVIDAGFKVTHEDLVDNLWVNTGETPGDGVDNDGNGFCDDVHGWNFDTYDNNLSGTNHGTKVAGCVGARGNNLLGVSGTCQLCQLMLLKHPSTDNQSDMAEAFGYASDMGADIINASWGYDPGIPITTELRQAIDYAVTNGRGGKGTIIFFAVRNENFETCDPTMEEELSALPNVIGVSGASNCDRFVKTGYGRCVDLLGPTWRGHIDTARITTTSNFSTGYTNSASGNSMATPIVAGIAGLVLDVAPHLGRLQVQRVLQDTTDRIEDTAANFDVNSGYSISGTHAYGRANAWEAVRLVAPSTDGGLGGSDVFFRDNRLDWGNTEQPSNVKFDSDTVCGSRKVIAHWNSVDIKVDAPPFQTPATNHGQFRDLTDEQPVPEETNRVYVRIRNRGPVTADSVTVKLHWALGGVSLPPLPSDFWIVFPADSSSTGDWHPIGSSVITDLEYSGSSVANSVGDQAQLVKFDWLAPPIDAVATSPQPHCLFAVADSPQDPLSSDSTSSLFVDDIAANDNNVTYRNVFLQGTHPTSTLRESTFVLRNPYPRRIRSRIEVSAPDGWRLQLDGASLNEPLKLKKNTTRSLTLRWDTAGSDQGTIDVIHYTKNRESRKQRKIIGGLSVVVSGGDSSRQRPKKKAAASAGCCQ